MNMVEETDTNPVSPTNQTQWSPMLNQILCKIQFQTNQIMNQDSIKQTTLTVLLLTMQTLTARVMPLKCFYCLNQG